ncbi:MAG: DNA alkylation repair protein [Methanimicrococcus sp.]|nr:DNA alkylation repair protein [Methanimicrococcus sp.]
MLTAKTVKTVLEESSDPERAKHLRGYFKTGAGGYGENDIFIGVHVPKMRALARKEYKNIPLDEIKILIVSPIHEHRQTALFFMTEKYGAACRKAIKGNGKMSPENQKETMREKKEIVTLYLENLAYVNNWDLTDASASYILGEWFLETEPETLGGKTLKHLSESGHLWEQRICVMTTHAFIRQGVFDPTLRLCEHFLPATHDLIHKCTGWMLREIGKRDESVLVRFLEEHAGEMPRTMLRYSIEKLDASQKEKYLNVKKRRDVTL